MMSKTKFLFCIFLFASFFCRAQHISNAMRFEDRTGVADSNKLSISYSNLFYFRDYEYFHNIQTGYTLFGTWHYPRITLQPNKWLKLEAGVLLQKEFGADDLDRVWPVFSLQLQQRNFRALFGAIEGNQSHGLIEPLMSYDKVIERPVEEGFQFKWKSKKVTADIWLDWELRQKENSDHAEELTGGLSFDYSLINPDKRWKLSIPVQFVAPHKGGELDTNQSVVTTVLNSAIGLKAGFVLPEQSDNWINEACLDAYYTGYYHDHKSSLYPFERGDGFLANLYLKSKWHFSFLTSYWKGHNYIAPKGGKLFQSISSISGRNDIENDRRLLFFNLMYEREITPGLFVDLRYHPYYDLRERFMEHGFLIMLSYRDIFNIGKLKK